MIHLAKPGSYAGDLSVDQANKLDILLSPLPSHDQQPMADFGRGRSEPGERSLIEDSCDKKLRNEFYADGIGGLMRSSRQSSLYADYPKDEAVLSSIRGQDDDMNH